MKQGDQVRIGDDWGTVELIYQDAIASGTGEYVSTTQVVVKMENGGRIKHINPRDIIEIKAMSNQNNEEFFINLLKKTGAIDQDSNPLIFEASDRVDDDRSSKEDDEITLIEIANSDERVKVTLSTWRKIVAFQKSCTDWPKLSKLLMYSEGKSVYGDVLHDWNKDCLDSPELKEDIIRLGKLNGFNTVLEFDAINNNGRLIRRHSLFGELSWFEYNEGQPVRGSEEYPPFDFDDPITRKQ